MGVACSPNHKRKFDCRTKTFSCQNRDADGNNIKKSTKQKQKSGQRNRQRSNQNDAVDQGAAMAAMDNDEINAFHQKWFPGAAMAIGDFVESRSDSTADAVAGDLCLYPFRSLANASWLLSK